MPPNSAVVNFKQKPSADALGSRRIKRDSLAVGPRGNRRQSSLVRRVTDPESLRPPGQGSPTCGGLLLLGPLIEELVLNLLIDADHPALGAERTILEVIDLGL